MTHTEHNAQYAALCLGSLHLYGYNPNRHCLLGATVWFCFQLCGDKNKHVLCVIEEYAYFFSNDMHKFLINEMYAHCIMHDLSISSPKNMG